MVAALAAAAARIVIEKNRCKAQPLPGAEVVAARPLAPWRLLRFPRLHTSCWTPKFAGKSHKAGLAEPALRPR